MVPIIALRQTGNKALLESVMVLFTGAYVCVSLDLNELSLCWQLVWCSLPRIRWKCNLIRFICCNCLAGVLIGAFVLLACHSIKNYEWLLRSYAYYYVCDTFHHTQHSRGYPTSKYRHIIFTLTYNNAGIKKIVKTLDHCLCRSSEMIFAIQNFTHWNCFQSSDILFPNSVISCIANSFNSVWRMQWPLILKKPTLYGWQENSEDIYSILISKG